MLLDSHGGRPAHPQGSVAAAASHARRPQRRRLPHRAVPDLEGPDRRPRVGPRLWLRLHGIREARGELRFGAARMRRFVMTKAGRRVVDEAGRIGDVTVLYRAYAEEYGVSTRTANNDFQAAEVDGMVRWTATAAPGRGSRYVLCLDLEQVPAVETLPGDLVAAVRRAMAGGQLVDVEEHQEVEERQDDAADEEHGQSDGGAGPESAPRRDPDGDRRRRVRCRIGRARGDALLADCEMWRYGAALSHRHHGGGSPGVLHASPLTREGNPHPRRDQGKRGTVPGDGRSRGTNRIDDKELAEGVLDRCGPAWRAQRGPGGGLDVDERARLVPLVDGALRYLASADVVAVLTDRVAGARSLAAVVASRARAVIQRGRAARRRADELADDTGQAYAAWSTSRAAAVAAHRPPPAVADELARFRAAHLAPPRPRRPWHTAAPDRAAGPRGAEHGRRAPYGGGRNTAETHRA